jgi:hypothetical protein
MAVLRVGFIGYEQANALDLVGPAEAFASAFRDKGNGKFERCYEVLILGLTKRPFVAESGIVFQPGAFKLAKAGLLAGKAATTHHEFLDKLRSEFPDILVKRGVRFVEGEKISTAGGLTSGTDLALRVVERYFGREIAQTTATYMEYQGKGWIV